MFTIQNFFNEKELSTMKPIHQKCPFCLEICGHIFNSCCLKICGQCLDDFYDNYPKSTELFKCIKCNKNVYDVSSCEASSGGD